MRTNAPSEQRSLEIPDGWFPGPLFLPPSIKRAPVRPKGREGRVHRAQTVRATPIWQSWQEKCAVAEMYAIARKLTRETGELHVVDHIVPKISPLVCGLHVSWNMQVMHWRANAIKSNAEWPDMPFEQIPLF